MPDKIELVNEVAAENFGLRSALESVAKGCTAKVEKAKPTGGASYPTLDQYGAETKELVSVLKNLISAGAEAGNLKAEVERLTSENTKLREQVSSFDSRVARETARKVAELGFCDRPVDITATAKPGTSGDAGLTDTQKVLKAKGLPISATVSISTAPAPESIEED